MAAALPATRVDAELRYNLFLALKETLNNIAKHAQATEVWLRLKIESDSFTLIVEDNGRGLTAATEAASGSQAGDRLAGIMNQNPYMRVLVFGGRCDLVCPIDTVHYALDHMQIDPAYRTNITYAEFDAGHMMYINLPDLKKLHATVEDFLK